MHIHIHTCTCTYGTVAVATRARAPPDHTASFSAFIHMYPCSMSLLAHAYIHTPAAGIFSVHACMYTRAVCRFLVHVYIRAVGLLKCLKSTYKPLQ